MAKRTKKMTVEILDVTPAMAKLFLKKNTHNRKLNVPTVEMLERSIKKGDWRLTHQGIAIYSDGSLADGQHRLTALINSGKTLRMPVFQNIERDIQTVMAIDCGKGRTVRDGAQLSGMSLGFSELAMARAFENGYIKFNRLRLTTMEQCELAQKWDSEITMIKKLFRANTKGITLTAVKVAAVEAAKDGANFDLVSEFCETLITGEYENPICVNAVKVRNRLSMNLQSARNFHSQREAYNMTYNAIFRTVAGEKIVQVNTNNP